MNNNIVFFFVCMLLITAKCNNADSIHSPIPSYENNYVTLDSLNTDSVNHVNYAYISDFSAKEEAPVTSVVALFPQYSPIFLGIEPYAPIWSYCLITKG